MSLPIFGTWPRGPALNISPQKKQRKTTGKIGVFPPKNEQPLLDGGKFNLYRQSTQDFFTAITEKLFFDEALLHAFLARTAMRNEA